LRSRFSAKQLRKSEEPIAKGNPLDAARLEPRPTTTSSILLRIPLSLRGESVPPRPSPVSVFLDLLSSDFSGRGERCRATFLLPYCSCMAFSASALRSRIATLRLSLTRPFSSIPMHLTQTRSPTFTTSSTLFTRKSANSEM
jgi:hypothetical protein